MAITFFQPTNNNANDFSGTVSGAGTSVVSGSGAGVGYAVVHAFHSGAATAPTFTGWGLTWAAIPALNIQTDADSHIWVYQGTGTLSSATTLSVTGGGMIGAGFSAVQVLGCNTASPRITTYLADTDGMGPNGTISFAMNTFENASNAALTFIVNLGGYTIDTTDTTQIYNTAGLFGSNDHRAAYGAANDNTLSLVPNSGGAAYAAFAIEIDESGTSSYSLTVDSASAAGEGQTISSPGQVIVESAQAAGQAFDVALLFDAAYVLPITNAGAAMEGQEIPFIYTLPGVSGAMAGEGQNISLLAQALVTVDAGQATAEGSQITLLNVLAIVVDAAAAAMSGSFIITTATGLAVSSGGVVSRRRRR